MPSATALSATFLAFVSSLFGGSAFAQSTAGADRWSKLDALRGGPQVRVELTSGERLTGVVQELDTVRLTLRERSGSTRSVERSSVKLVSRKSRARGALYGFFAGFGAGFVTGAAAGPYITDFGNPGAGRRVKYGVGWGSLFGGVGAGIGALTGARVYVYR